MYEIILYKDKNGKSEIEDYIKKLKQQAITSKDSKVKFNKIISYIRMIRDYGIRIKEPYVKHLHGEIWELRPLRDRILFAYWENNKFILLHIFMKQTQKTPSREIRIAKNNLKEYKNRKDGNYG